MSMLTTNTGTYWIVSVRTFTVRVSSDRAMIDSGNRVEYTIWRDDLGMTQEIEYEPSGPNLNADDCPAKVVAAAAQYVESLRWLEGLLSAVYKAHREQTRKPVAGDTVEVFKGRKVPKGIYTVRYAGESQFGPYYDLTNSNDTTYRYVAVDNCKRVVEAVDAIPGVPRELLGILQHLSGWSIHRYTDDAQKEALAVLCDRLEDMDSPHLPAIKALHRAHATDEGIRHRYGWTAPQTAD